MSVVDMSVLDRDVEFSLGLDLGIEELDDAIAPEWSWGDFAAGVGVGIGLVGLYAAGAALAT